MLTDPVADMLTRIRNANKALQDRVEMPSSKLKEQGYVEDFSVGPAGEGRPGDVITVTLKYTTERKPVITGLERVSRPGRRRYVDHAHIPRIQGGMGTAIIFTSRGVMTGHDARMEGVGGEVVARVW